MEEKKRFNELHRFTDPEDLVSAPRFANPVLTDEEKIENLEREKKIDLLNDEAAKEQLQTILDEFRNVSAEKIPERGSNDPTTTIHSSITKDDKDMDKMISKSLLDIRHGSKGDVNGSKGKFQCN